MPKLKTKRAAAKRFRTTGTGKFMYNKSCKSHLLTHKSRKRKRRLRKSAVVSDVSVTSLARMIPFV